MRWIRNLQGTLIAVVALAAAAIAPGIGAAQSVVSTGQSFVSGRIIPGSRQDDGSRLAGLQLTLAHGWKTYWRSPGEAGVPPSFDWSRSENVAGVEVLWPRPELFESFGLRTVGYRGRVVLPLRVTPADPSKPIRLALDANLGVCNEMCVFESFALAETIAADAQPVDASAIASAAATVPVPAEDAGLTAATCQFTGTGRDRELSLRLDFRDALIAPVVLLEGTDQIWVKDTATDQPEAGVVQLTARLKLASDATWIDRGAFRATVLADNMAADVRGCRGPAG